ncbi:MAG: xanthine dehydrogenase family protein subunit M [Roseovarius confluentis]
MTGYTRPETLDDALALLAQTGGRVAAGCTDLFPATGARALQGPVVDITGLAGLRGVAVTDEELRIGAATTWTDILKAKLPPACDMLKQAAREVGSSQIQNAGTIAGNLCNASPAADGVPCLLALDAEVELVSGECVRRLPLKDFIVGPRRTALTPGEIVTSVHVPRSALNGRSRFLKLGARRYLVISIAMVAVRLVVEGGRISDVALAVGACSAVATRLPQVEAVLRERAADHTLADVISEDAVCAALSPLDDMRATAGYRGHAATELLRRAVADAVGAEGVS